MNTDDLFFDVYDREDLAYGLKPSSELASYLSQVGLTGLAIDLGAGAGRNSLALARAGLKVLAIDMSERGMDRLMELATARGVDHLVTTKVADVREVDLPRKGVSVIVATTVLDHIPEPDANALWERIEQSLASDGVIYAEVHTKEDPGCDQFPGCDNPYPVSETASFVVNYFGAGDLLKLALKSGELRVLRYEERQEWDYTHGHAHHHGKAVLVAVRKGHYPSWYGHPLAFPRRWEKESDP